MSGAPFPGSGAGASHGFAGGTAEEEGMEDADGLRRVTVEEYDPRLHDAHLLTSARRGAGRLRLRRAFTADAPAASDISGSSMDEEGTEGAGGAPAVPFVRRSAARRAARCASAGSGAGDEDEEEGALFSAAMDAEADAGDLSFTGNLMEYMAAQRQRRRAALSDIGLGDGRGSDEDSEVGIAREHGKASEGSEDDEAEGSEGAESDEGADGAAAAGAAGGARKKTTSTLGYEFASAESEARYDACVGVANDAWAKDNADLALPPEKSRNRLRSFAAYASRVHGVDVCSAASAEIKMCFEGFIGAFAAAQKAKKGAATAGTLANMRSEIAIAFVWLTQRDAPADVFNGRKTKLFQGQVRKEKAAAGIAERRAPPLSHSSLISMGRAAFRGAAAADTFTESLIVLRDHAAFLFSCGTGTRVIDPSRTRLGDLQIEHHAGAPFGIVLVCMRGTHKGSRSTVPDPLFVPPVLDAIEACALLFTALWLVTSWPLRLAAAAQAKIKVEMTMLFPG